MHALHDPSSVSQVLATFDVPLDEAWRDPAGVALASAAKRIAVFVGVQRVRSMLRASTPADAYGQHDSSVPPATHRPLRRRSTHTKAAYFSLSVGRVRPLLEAAPCTHSAAHGRLYHGRNPVSHALAIFTSVRAYPPRIGSRTSDRGSQWHPGDTNR